MKSAFVTIAGRPSAGKSTILNALCEFKVSIVSPVPQTTRNKIRGIVTREEGQLIFVDTPGYHSSERKFNLSMKSLVHTSLEESEMVLYVVDVTREPGNEETEIVTVLHDSGLPVIVAMNKVDKSRKFQAAYKELLEEHLPDAVAVPVSALNGEGMDTLVKALFAAAPEGDQMYPEDIVTDQEPSFRIAEIIREKAMLNTKDELPHSLYVEIADMEQRENTTLWVRAFIVVDRESQKGIVVGRGGEKIRTIRMEAQKEIEDIFPYPVYLDIRVKVMNKWRTKDALIKRLIT